jgi:cytochrome c biogenesis protein
MSSINYVRAVIKKKAVQRLPSVVIAIKSRPIGEGTTPPLTSAIDQIYRFLASIRFTILILSFIAISCITGTLVKQQASPEEYVSHFSDSTYAILKFFGLTDVFHAPWFLFLIGLFVINLVFCTTSRLARLLKGNKEWKLPDQKGLASMPLSFVARGKTLEQAAGALKGYSHRDVEGRGMILDKGALSRYGAYIIHASIIVILIGSVVGLLFGHRGFVNINQGETRDTVISRDKSGKILPLGFAIKCDKFDVSFYPGGEPKDYVSTLEIIDRGKSVKKAEVRVNHPLSYKGTRIYQASYGSNSLATFFIEGENVTLPQGAVHKQGKLTFMVTRFEREVHNFGPGVQVVYVEGDQQKTSWFLKNVPGHRDRMLAGVPVKLVSMTQEFYTGLEVTRDPGVWIVWTGFALILFGLYVNFFMYDRRIYLLKTEDGVLIAGSAPRNKEGFREEFEKLKERNR